MGHRGYVMATRDRDRKPILFRVEGEWLDGIAEAGIKVAAQQNRYMQMRAAGESHNMATILATRRAPAARVT